MEHKSCQIGHAKTGKCKIIYLGTKNESQTYQVKTVFLNSAVSGKSLGSQ